MALALVRHAGSDGTRISFDLVLGSNRYFAYAIGDGATRRVHGVPVLLDPGHTSAVVGPIRDHPVGRTRLHVPAELFDRDHRFIQVVSYRDPGGAGPAASEPLAVLPPLWLDDPAISFAWGETMSTTIRQPVPFAVVEQRPLSQSQFLSALMPVLQQLAPVVGGILGGLGGGGSAPAAAPAAGVGPPASGNLPVQEIIRLIQQVLAHARTGGGTPARAAHGAGQASVSAASSGPRALRRNGPGRGGNGGAGAATLRTGLTAMASPGTRRLSEAKIVDGGLVTGPALMALLGPLLQQVLTPETVQAVLKVADPTRMVSAISDGLVEVGRVAIESDEQEKRHLRELINLQDPEVSSLLAGMSVAASARSRHGPPAYRRVDAVRLEPVAPPPILLAGRHRNGVAAGHDLTLPIEVRTARRIPGAQLYVFIKDTATGDYVVGRRFEVPAFAAGRLPVEPRIPAGVLDRLDRGEDYMLCLHLVWKQNGQRMGTSRMQAITPLAGLAFDRMEEGGALVPLNDPHRDRALWHKVLQDTLTPERRSLDYQCKYYYMPDSDRAEHARMETVTRVDEHRYHKEVGRLKSGMVLSLDALNAMIPRISDAPALGPEELAALRNTDFQDRLRHAARFQADFRGRVGASVALWVYPVVRLQNVILAELDVANGRVTGLRERRIRFPVPVMIHTIGARSPS